MNAFIILSALVSAAVAVPHNSRLLDSYGSDSYGSNGGYDRGYGETRILTKSYDEPRIVLRKSYEEPRILLKKSYDEPRIVLRKSYDDSDNSYGRSYGDHQVLTKSYSAPVSTHYSIRHDAPQKSYHSQPIIKTYATKSYGYNDDSDSGYGKGY